MDNGRQAGGEADAAELPPLRANEVRLWLSVIAYNLGNLWRRLALPTRVDTRRLTNLQQRLVKTGGWLIKHARLLATAGGEHLTRWSYNKTQRDHRSRPPNPVAIWSDQMPKDWRVYLVRKT
jgi:hypothetical protein